GPFLERHGIHVVFALPSMILATIFVSLPFVVREVVPVLREIGTEQEQAASTLGASGFQTLVRIPLPANRWAIAYGVVLTTARCLGEFGAVSVVRGHLVGHTETATLYLHEQFECVHADGHALRAGSFRGLRPDRRIRGLRAPGADRDRDAPGHERLSAQGGDAV